MALAPATSPEEALWSGICATLLGNEKVKAIVADRVFDEIPADDKRPAPPWLYLGVINAQHVETGDGVALRVSYRIYAASTNFGRWQCWNAINAAREALHLAEPPVDGYERIGPLIVVQSGDIVDPLTAKEAFLDVRTDLLVAESHFPLGLTP